MSWGARRRGSVCVTWAEVVVYHMLWGEEGAEGTEWCGGKDDTPTSGVYEGRESTGGQLSATLNMRQKVGSEKQGAWDRWEKGERKTGKLKTRRGDVTETQKSCADWHQVLLRKVERHGEERKNIYGATTVDFGLSLLLHGNVKEICWGHRWHLLDYSGRFMGPSNLKAGGHIQTLLHALTITHTHLYTHTHRK